MGGVFYVGVFKRNIFLNKILEAINIAEELYSRLILIVCKTPEDVEFVLSQFKEKQDFPIININKELSQILLNQTVKSRK